MVVELRLSEEASRLASGSARTRHEVLRRAFAMIAILLPLPAGENSRHSGLPARSPGQADQLARAHATRCRASGLSAEGVP